MVTGLPGQKGPSGTSGVNWGTVLEGCVCVWAGGVHGPGQGCRKNTQSSCALFPAYNRHLMSLLHAGGAPGRQEEGPAPSSPVGIPHPALRPLLLGVTAGPGPHITQVRGPWLCQHQVTFLYTDEQMGDITY